MTTKEVGVVVVSVRAFVDVAQYTIREKIIDSRVGPGGDYMESMLNGSARCTKVKQACDK